jgi:hypothetical protein
LALYCLFLRQLQWKFLLSIFHAHSYKEIRFNKNKTFSRSEPTKIKLLVVLNSESTSDMSRYAVKFSMHHCKNQNWGHWMWMSFCVIELRLEAHWGRVQKRVVYSWQFSSVHTSVQDLKQLGIGNHFYEIQHGGDSLKFTSDIRKQSWHNVMSTRKKHVRKVATKSAWHQNVMMKFSSTSNVMWLWHHGGVGWSESMTLITCRFAQTCYMYNDRFEAD